MSEIWVGVRGFLHYEVSNLGRVRSLDRVVRRGYGSRGLFRGRILKLASTGKGYKFVTLRKANRSVAKYVHRLVAEHFCNGKAIGLEVNHLNLDKTDNRSCNLEWVTHRQNQLHAGANGVMSRKDQRLARLLRVQAITNGAAAQ